MSSTSRDFWSIVLIDDEKKLNRNVSQHRFKVPVRSSTSEDTGVSLQIDEIEVKFEKNQHLRAFDKELLKIQGHSRARGVAVVSVR
eukprot:IDg23623t1